ncbi:ubiquitin-specific protease [Trifolium repens]|nr:ubiquitin-specific protease [Trifolium repens]
MSEFLSIYALLLTKGHTKLPFAVFVGRLANPLSHEAFSVFDHITCVIVSLFSCLFSIHNNRSKFDHERVTKEDPKRALEEQYGGVEELPQTNPGFNNTPFKFTKYSNAYTLVYIREVDKEKVICYVDEKDIAVALDILKSHTRTVPGVIEAVEELDKILAFINLLISSH